MNSSNELPDSVTKPPRVFAVVPAAGLSRRMGRPKLSLPLGEKTVLQRVLLALNRSRVDAVALIIAPSSHFLASYASPPTELVEMSQDTADMRETVMAGLRCIAERHHPAPADAFLLALGDQPAIRSSTVDRLVVEHMTAPENILVPAFRGKRGHPVLFPWSFVFDLDSLPADRGLNELLKTHPDRVIEIPFEEPAILEDLDFPEDYVRHQRRNWED